MGNKFVFRASSERLRRIGGLILVGLAAVGISVGATEWYQRSTEAPNLSGQPTYARLAAAHAPFSAKYPHPVYGFFFPADSQRRNQLNNEIVAVSADGFRGQGPEDAGERELAFLVGNSVVFGFVENDSLTIAGFLNRIQTRFFFVNAGVPSWTSRQILKRLIRELLPYRPSLVVFWAGHNDVSSAFHVSETGHAAPDGAPAPLGRTIVRLAESIAPSSMALLRRYLSRTHPDERPSPTLAAAIAAADSFAGNLATAYEACADAGVEFLGVYQPDLALHDHSPPGSIGNEERAFFEAFHDSVLAGLSKSEVPLLDLGAFFDRNFAEVPVFEAGHGPDLEDQVFIDPVHLYVPGNALVASAIANRLAGNVAEASKRPLEK